MRLFARHEARGGALICPDLADINRLNSEGYGIFHAVNGLDWSKVSKSGRGRTQENVTEIIFWTVESDSLSIDEQWSLINNFLEPSMVIRSKKSLHVYWHVDDIAKGPDNELYCTQPTIKKHYKTIQLALAEYFQGDRAIQHSAHVLRAPGYYHHKKEPFKVEKVLDKNNSYKFEDMVSALNTKLKRDILSPKPVKKIDISKPVREPRVFDGNKSPFFEKLDSMHQGELLQRLSGKLHGDTIELLDNRNGSYNIKINNKTCEAWVTSDGHIGSRLGGGPTIVQWVEYYGYSTREAINFIKDNIQELREVK